MGVGIADGGAHAGECGVWGAGSWNKKGTLALGPKRGQFGVLGFGKVGVDGLTSVMVPGTG